MCLFVSLPHVTPKQFVALGRPCDWHHDSRFVWASPINKLKGWQANTTTQNAFGQHVYSTAHFITLCSVRLCSQLFFCFPLHSCIPPPAPLCTNSNLSLQVPFLLLLPSVPVTRLYPTAQHTGLTLPAAIHALPTVQSDKQVHLYSHVPSRGTVVLCSDI